MDPENVTLGEISQRKPNTVWHHLYMESKKIKLSSKYNKKETDSHVENKLWFPKGRGKGGEANRSRGLRYTNHSGLRLLT